ncbi:AAA family ATPase [Aeromonas dhakensis]|uniref:AAA family ATPase n=1 Tax=Aeromonas dhakensis TaxID=196024 RepID=UPI0019202279|nr:AAA family ATPase [Aeromonas dhakensis]
MKISKIKLNNFRGYKDILVDFDDSFNVIIGRNDIGKSTILEALEIFFNNETVREFNFEVRHSPMPPDGTLRIP